MPNAQAALERLSDPAHEVSAHYFLDQSGGAVQLVPEAQRAWHAGAGAWGGCTDINSASIGIELCNAGDHAFSSAQMQALKSLLKEVMQRWGIAAQGVIGHSDMAPGRKQDPGRWFDWQDLAKEGLAVYRGAPHSRLLPFAEAAESGSVIVGRKGRLRRKPCLRPFANGFAQRPQVRSTKMMCRSYLISRKPIPRLLDSCAGARLRICPYPCPSRRLDPAWQGS